MEGLFLPPGEGEELAVGGASASIKATSAESDGRLFVSEAVAPPGFAGPPLHLHRTLCDAFWVLEGTLTVRLGDDTVEAPAGSFVCVPPGVAHTFSNPGDRPVRFLNLNSPGGWEEYLRDMGSAMSGGGPPSPEAMAEIAARHDFVPVEQS